MPFIRSGRPWPIFDGGQGALKAGEREGAPGIWRLIANAGEAMSAGEIAGLGPVIARFSDIVSPALAAYLLAPAAATPLIDAEAAEQSRLLNRYRRHVAIDWARVIAEAGIDTVYLKGFAVAHAVYPDADLRAMSDVDILVRGADRDRLIGLLSDHGFAFRDPGGRPWGSVNDASYLPFVAADGSANFDIHIHPDAFPVYRTLTTDLVFKAAQDIDIGALTIRVPSPSHMYLLAASHAGRDKFGPFATTNLIDAMFLLERRREEINWRHIEALARRGGYPRPLDVFAALLRRLGLECRGRAPLAAAMPEALQGLAGWEFSRLVADYAAMFPRRVSLLTLLRREFFLGGGPDIALRRHLARVRGMVRPASGLPSA